MVIMRRIHSIRLTPEHMKSWALMTKPESVVPISSWKLLKTDRSTSTHSKPWTEQITDINKITDPKNLHSTLVETCTLPPSGFYDVHSTELHTTQVSMEENRRTLHCYILHIPGFYIQQVLTIVTNYSANCYFYKMYMSSMREHIMSNKIFISVYIKWKNICCGPQMQNCYFEVKLVFLGVFYCLPLGFRLVVGQFHGIM